MLDRRALTVADWSGSRDYESECLQYACLLGGELDAGILPSLAGTTRAHHHEFVDGALDNPYRSTYDHVGKARI